MSRLWAERLRIGLAPGRVELVRLGLTGGGRPVKAAGVAVAPAPDAPPWSAALEALDAPLAGFAARGAAVAVVLSNHWVRYLVLPWQPTLVGPAELHALARLRFERTFGEAAAGWTIRCSDPAWGEATVACAVDAALIDALRARLAARRLRLASVQPLLMAAYNQVRRQLATGAAFAIVESGRLCLGLFDQGHWRDIVSRRAGADPAAVLEQELASAAPQPGAAALDVLLVGEGAAWPADAPRPARLLGTGGAPVSLALCGCA